MNLPMGENEALRVIHASPATLALPDTIKRLLRGSRVLWRDDTPLSQDVNDDLHFYFETKTNAAGDLLLKKYGLHDVGLIVNVKLHYRAEIEIVYTMPNRLDCEKQHTETCFFNFYGSIAPLSEKFTQNRDKHFLRAQLELGMVPCDHKNKKVYSHTNFRLIVV
jgi:hypothetical protein